MFQVLWFKRDLRLSDHAPLREALASGLPVLAVYLYEPGYWQQPTASARHEAFVWQALADLQEGLTLQSQGRLQLYCLETEALPFFERLLALQGPFRLLSHEEVGEAWSYARDRALKAWTRQKGLVWTEYPYAAVIRGLKDRQNWFEAREAYMAAPVASPWIAHWQGAKGLALPPEFQPLLRHPQTQAQAQQGAIQGMQPGGLKAAWAYLRSFVWQRVEGYMRQISKPQGARYHCSRLSPYLAWGCLSLREVLQYTEAVAEMRPWRRQYEAFASRLAWHCHFIQRFEMSCEMEYQSLHPAYDSLWPAEPDQTALQAWQEGRTGIPLVDACMRSLAATGYLNFRMRAMLVSFLCHHLQLPWQSGVQHLARLFLDFEPGIHYCQFQMQAGCMGINRFRVYNPVKQAEEQDPQAEFIKTWLPELRNLPPHLAQAPWKIRPLEAQFLNFRPGEDYPLAPYAQWEAQAQAMRRKLYAHAAEWEVRQQAQAIVRRHVGRRKIGD